MAVLVVLMLGGCAATEQAGYYAQAVRGHLDLLRQARPVDDWLQDQATDAVLRERLALSQRMRDFAVQELALPDNRSYRRYADLGRPFVVWNVVAAPELSLTLKTWCVPVAGCVGYRGYFSEAAARAQAETLREQGWEVAVYGVPAYSTLGRLDWLGGDPLLNTFVHYTEGELARLIFHELAHQVVYVTDDTTFNESFATAVERLGGQRWLEQQGSAQARESYRVFDERRREFQALTRAYRARLAELYASALDDDAKRAGKQALMQAMRQDYDTLKRERWQGFSGYDRWMERANNALLATQAAYTELVPGFERLFHEQGGDFVRFYDAVRELAALPPGERRQRLAAPPVGSAVPPAAPTAVEALPAS